MKREIGVGVNLSDTGDYNLTVNQIDSDPEVTNDQRPTTVLS